MTPAALVAIAVLFALVMQQQRRHAGPARNPYNPRRRRRPGAGQLELPETPKAYPVYHVAGGGDLPGRKKQPYWVFAQWAGVSSDDLRWFSHDPVGRSFPSYAEAADVARDLARRTGGVVEDSREGRRRLLNRNPRRRRRPEPGQLALPERSAVEEYRERQAALRAELERLRDETPNLRDFGLDRRDDYERAIEAHGRRIRALQNERERLGYESRGLPVPERFRNPRRRRRWRNPQRVQSSAQCCRCGSGYPCIQQNPGYQAACRVGPGHVWDIGRGGRCQCCGRMAPKRLVTLEWDAGGQTSYGRVCAARAIGTTRLRTNQLAHMEREAGHRGEREAHYRGARGQSGIVRPPFARGWSEADITELARRVGESPFEPSWWLSQTANLVPGHYQKVRSVTPSGQVAYVRGRYVPPSGEFRRYVTEGGQRAQKRQRGGGTARSARPSRARAAGPIGRPGDDLPF